MTLASAEPQARLHWEDIEEGATFDLGSRSVDKHEIMEFARTFDPQPVHVDEGAAKESMFGRLFASGWHSCAILMRLMTDGLLNRAAALGSGGIEEARFMKPVFADEPLSGRATCKGKRALSSKPDIGTCHFIFELLNAKGEPVLSLDSQIFMRRRTPASTAAGTNA